MSETEQTVPSIRGWLLLPLTFLGFWCMWGAFVIAEYLPTWIARTLAYGPGPKLDHPAVVLPVLVLIGLSLYTLFCFLRRSRQTRLLMIVLCALMLVFLAALYVFPPHYARGGPAIAAAGSLLYFVFSKRVKTTFIR